MNASGLASSHLGTNLLRVAEQRTWHATAASCGSVLLDEVVLGGGFRYGELTSIAGASGTGKSTMAYHAVASHLLRNECDEVAFVDANGSFSAERLRDVITLHLRSEQPKGFKQAGYMYKESPPKTPLDHNEALLKASLMLDRVRLLSTFSISGVVEAVGEIREALEKFKEAWESTSLRGIDCGITHSEDEQDLKKGLEMELTNRKARDAVKGVGQIRMLIVDTVAAVANPLLAKDYIQGNMPPSPKQ